MTVFPIRVGQEEDFFCAPDQTVLQAMERAGKQSLAVGCRGGGCGACKVRVVSGDYRCGRMSRLHVTETERAAGYALSCRLYPETGLVLERVHRLFEE